MDTDAAYILDIIKAQRATLVKEATDIVASPLPRDTSEQVMVGVVSVLEEALRGDKDDFRRTFLNTALPAVVDSGTITWPDMLSSGLPCWGVLVGILASKASAERQAATINRLSLIMGAWWRDVSNAVLPLYKARGEL